MLRNVAYLVISSNSIGEADGVFELHHDLEIESQLEKSYLVGNFGTAIQEATRAVGGEELLTGESYAERRQGYSVDAGGGTWGGSLTFTTGFEGATWGDGTDDPEQENGVTMTDASGEGVHPLTRLHILQFWLANTLTDSRAQARLHIGQWTDGSFDDYRDGSYVDVDAGVYGHPIPVAILACEPRKPQDEPSNMTATLQYRRTQVIDGAIEDVADWVTDVAGDAADFFTDAAEDFGDA